MMIKSLISQSTISSKIVVFRKSKSPKIYHGVQTSYHILQFLEKLLKWDWDFIFLSQFLKSHLIYHINQIKFLSLFFSVSPDPYLLMEHTKNLTFFLNPTFPLPFYLFEEYGKSYLGFFGWWDDRWLMILNDGWW